MEIASRKEFVAKIKTTSLKILQCRLGNVQREIRRHAEACVRVTRDILDLIRTRRDGDTEQLIKYKQLTTELSDKMAVKSSEDRYVLCSRNSETVTNWKKVY